MSYILDALKKSEAQRHAGKIPTAVAAQGVAVESAQRKRIGVIGWIAPIILAALGIAWAAREYFDRPFGVAALQPVVGAQTTTPVERPSHAELAPPLDPQAGGEPIPRLKLASSLPTRDQAAVPPPREPASRAVPASPPASVPLPGREPAAPSSAAPSSAAASSAAASTFRGAVLAYSDLPPAIRHALPPLVVGGFAAGESGGTMVVVDDKLVREGDEVAPGIRVEKILSDTAEFSYKGYRFRR